MSERSTVLLEHHLKELKLPTFLREYGKVAGQCAAEDVDHPGYLLRLSELELIDRHHRMVDRRIDLPPKNWSRCNVSPGPERKGGKDGKEEAYSRADHQQAQRGGGGHIGR